MSFTRLTLCVSPSRMRSRCSTSFGLMIWLGALATSGLPELGDLPDVPHAELRGGRPEHLRLLDPRGHLRRGALAHLAEHRVDAALLDLLAPVLHRVRRSARWSPNEAMWTCRPVSSG